MQQNQRRNQLTANDTCVPTSFTLSPTLGRSFSRFVVFVESASSVEGRGAKRGDGWKRCLPLSFFALCDNKAVHPLFPSLRVWSPPNPTCPSVAPSFQKPLQVRIVSLLGAAVTGNNRNSPILTTGGTLLEPVACHGQSVPCCSVMTPTGLPVCNQWPEKPTKLGTISS